MPISSKEEERRIRLLHVPTLGYVCVLSITVAVQEEEEEVVSYGSHRRK